jgi:acetylornithine deacetylase
VRSLIGYLRDHSPNAACCIVGEPTLMQPVIGHKGGCSYRVRVTGREAHSSLAPQAVNAIAFAAELIGFLNTLADSMQSGPSDPLYDIAHSTLSVGMIHGGSAINIVPRQCEFVFEFRYLLGVDPDAIMASIKDHVHHLLLPRMRTTAAEADISFENIYAYPLFNIDSSHELVTRVKAWAGSNAEAKVAYGTEAGYFSAELGIPTIVCGPGSILQAHKPDEFVERSQLDACDAFLRKVGSYCAM